MAFTISKSTNITLSGTTITVGELRDILDDYYSDGVISFHLHKGGSDPREHDYVTLTVTHD